ncbi:MAG: cohesin domain-containing protein [Acidobacteriota bacterium]|nr:cohesin domain-containing protein [Acidobacteriota bacterium]
MRYLCCICLLITLSCVPNKKEMKLAAKATDAGRWTEAYERWSGILEEHPDNVKAKLEKERARMNASLYHLDRAGRFYRAKKYNETLFELNLALGFDPDNQEGQRLLRNAMEKRKEQEAIAAGKKVQQKKKGITVPRLRPSTWDPQNLSFTNKSIRDVYTSMGRAYGINIVLDSKIRDDKTTIDLRNLSFIRALDTLMVVNRHFFKVIDNNTIIIMEDNNKTREQHQNQIIRTFYLSNITPKDLKQHLRQLGNIKEFAENERLNAVTIKGSAEQMALAEKIIRDNDKSRPEVIVEIEFLEVNKNLSRRVGIQPTDNSGNALYRAGVIADPVGRSNSDEDRGGIRGIFPSLDEQDFLTIVPALAIDFLKDQGDSRQVANPHLRITSGEKGEIRIGQSVPVVNTSFTTSGLSGSTSGTNAFGDQALTSFNYQEVGIDMKITPRVHYNNEISLELEMEISSVLSAGLQPIFGKRQVTTSLRLKNGEMNVLAGLLSEDERRSLVGIAGLSDIPILGKLFTNDEKVASKTDIIMTIKPVIIRGPDIGEADRAPYEISSLRLSSLYSEEGLAAESEKPGESDAAPEPDMTEPAYEEDPAPDEAEPEPDEGSTETIDPEEDYPEEEEEGPPPAMLAFTPANQEGRQDDMIEFSVFITNVEGMSRGEVTVSFDASILQAEAVEMGDFFGSGRRPHLTPAWNNDQGNISMIITQRMGGEPFSGSGILATLRFRAKSPGSGELTFRNPVLKKKDGALIPVQGLPAMYEVNP